MLIDQSMRKKRLKAWGHTAQMPSSSLGILSIGLLSSMRPAPKRA